MDWKKKGIPRQRSCFAKRGTKTAAAPPEELFMEPKPKKKASLVKWSRAKQDLGVLDPVFCVLATRIEFKLIYIMYQFIGRETVKLICSSACWTGWKARQNGPCQVQRPFAKRSQTRLHDSLHCFSVVCSIYKLSACLYVLLLHR